MSRAVVCAVLVACATPLEVEKLPPPGPPPTADAIVAQMLATYAHIKTYADHGDVSTWFQHDGIPNEVKHVDFRTNFDRPNARFDLFVDQPSKQLSIWTDGNSVLSTTPLKAGRIDQYPSVGAAVEWLKNGSDVAAVWQPLFGGSAVIAQLQNPTIGGTEVVGGVPCWRIDASINDGRQASLWLDKTSHLIRRVVVKTHFERIDAYQRVDYAPTIDGPVSVQSIDAHGSTLVDNRNPTWIGVRFDGSTTKITQVIAKGPAERAGLAIDDEIVSVNGDAVAKSNDVITRVRGTKPGGRIALRLQRHGSPLDISLAAEVMPDVDKLTHDALIDKPAPDFSLPVVNANGSATLADLAKDIVVVDFWATWCKPCEIARPHLNEIQAKHAGKLHVVAISNEDLKDITDYVASHEMKFTVAHDPDGKVWSSYIVGGLPTTVVIAKGLIRYVGVGVDDAALDDAVAKALAP